MSNDQNAIKHHIFSPTISTGNILQLLVMAGGIGWAWMNLDSRVQANEIRSTSMVSTVEKLQEAAMPIQTRVRNNEIALSRQDERTNSILTGIARIEIQLRQIDRRLNGDNGR